MKMKEKPWRQKYASKRLTGSVKYGALQKTLLSYMSLFDNVLCQPFKEM